MTTDQICQKLFLDKSSSQHEIRCFFSAHILLSLQKFFNVLNSMSKIALPRYSRVSYKKNEWMRSWSLTQCKPHISRCDVEKHCLIIFSALLVQWKATRAKWQHPMLWVLCSVATLFFLGQIYNFCFLSKTFGLFLFLQKGQMKFGFFWPIRFCAVSADLKMILSDF